MLTLARGESVATPCPLEGSDVERLVQFELAVFCASKPNVRKGALAPDLHVGLKLDLGGGQL